MNINAETYRGDIKKKLIGALASAVKQTAEIGEWCLPVDGLTQENASENITQIALQMAMKQLRGEAVNIPSWFSSCICAAKTIIAEDEMQGMECVAALYVSTDKALAEQRLEAVQQLLHVIAPATTGGAPALGMLGAI